MQFTGARLRIISIMPMMLCAPSIPISAAPMSLRHLAEQEARLSRIAVRISAKAVTACRDRSISQGSASSSADSREQPAVATRPSCAGKISLVNSGRRNAWSDGQCVVVTTGMIRLARSDDELAFVIAHEMAHNILGHSQVRLPGIFGIKFGGKKQELAADSLAVRLMTDGGYDAGGGINFLRGARRRLWWNMSLDHPSFGRRIANVTHTMKAEARSRVSPL